MKENSKRPDMTSLSLRLVAGLYLLYIDYSLIKEWNSGSNANRVIIALAMILFAVVGVLLLAHSVKNMILLRKQPQTAQEKAEDSSDVTGEIEQEEYNDENEETEKLNESDNE